MEADERLPVGRTVCPKCGQRIQLAWSAEELVRFLREFQVPSVTWVEAVGKREEA